jgi:hypothetical protein
MGERAMAVLAPTFIGSQGTSLNCLRAFLMSADDGSGLQPWTHKSGPVLTRLTCRRRSPLVYVDRKESER